MADVNIQENPYNGIELGSRQIGAIWTSALVGYAVILTSAITVLVHKTADGGATWDAGTSLGGGFSRAFTWWFDKHTPGDSGTVIHVAWMEILADDEIRYNSFDTSDDSVSGEILALTLVSIGASPTMSMTKAVGGNLYIQYWADVDGEHGLLQSVDDGDNWTERLSGADGNEVDRIDLMPDGTAADTEDICMLYLDVSADELSFKKYDNSENTWGETAITTVVESAEGLNFGATIRHSDGHILVCVMTDNDAATADLEIWDITPTTPTITAKTDVITDKDDVGFPSIFCDQNNDDLYVSYAGMDDGSQALLSLVDIHYQKSADGGGTWGGETTYSVDTADDHRMTGGGVSTPGANPGLYSILWFNLDTTRIFTNAVSAVVLGGSPFIRQVNVSGDDVFRRLISSYFATNDPSNYFGDQNVSFSDHFTGLRFSGVTVPKNAVITEAKVYFTAKGMNSGLPTITVKAEAADSPAAPTTDEDYDGRSRGEQSASWTPAAWTTDTEYATSDIKDVVQELVDRAGWVSGNALLLFFEVTAGWGGVDNQIWAYAFDDTGGANPRIEISYSSASAETVGGAQALMSLLGIGL